MNATLDSIWKILGTAAGIFATIQGLKNLIPSLFAKLGNLGLYLAAAGALVTTVLTCRSATGALDINCVYTAILTFLSAVGIYHSVAQASGNQVGGSTVTPAAQLAAVGIKRSSK